MFGEPLILAVRSLPADSPNVAISVRCPSLEWEGQIREFLERAQLPPVPGQSWLQSRLDRADMTVALMPLFNELAAVQKSLRNLQSLYRLRWQTHSQPLLHNVSVDKSAGGEHRGDGDDGVDPLTTLGELQTLMKSLLQQYRKWSDFRVSVVPS